MFTNALTGANYEFQNANLWELREKIIEQEHLTTLDILKGFHEKSKIKVELPEKYVKSYFEVTDNILNPLT